MGQTEAICHHLSWRPRLMMRTLPTHLDHTVSTGLCQSSSPQDALQHRECSPELWTADLHGEDAGADDPITHSNKYPGKWKY